MEDIFELRAMKLSWNKVCNIISEEIENIVGLHIQCMTNVVEHYFWSVEFVGYRLPLPKLCQLIQVTQPTPEDWEDAMPDDGGVDVNGIGMVLCEKLLVRHLKLTWEHSLITEGSLWLVGVAPAPCYPKTDDERPERIEIYWQDLTPAKQSEILRAFGENGNWDVFPIATIDMPAEADLERESRARVPSYYYFMEADNESQGVYPQPQGP